MYNRLFNVLWGVITILSFSNAMGQKILTQPEIQQGMEDKRDWYDPATRKYIFSYLYSRSSPNNPEKASNTYDYVRVEREFLIKADGTKFIRWYLTFNAKRPHHTRYGANFYGIMLGSSVGRIHNLYYRVYDENNALISGQSYTGDVFGWRDQSTKYYYSAADGQGVNLSSNFYRHIVYNNTRASYDARWDYTKPEAHNARAQLIKHGVDADTGVGQVIINQGPTQSDAYMYVYQFDTDILNDTKEHYYVAFHNIDNNNYGTHLLAFLPPPDGQPETTVYVKPTPQTITTEVGVVPDVKRGIRNLSTFPNDAVWEWVSAPDVSKVGTTQGKAKVTYYVNNEPVRMEVLIPVVVEDNKKDKDIYAPTGNTIRFLNGENLANKAGEFIILPASYPTDKAKPTYAWKDGTPATTTGGSFTKVVNVMYPDNSIDEVNVNLDIVDTPIQDIVQIIRGTSEAQAKEKVKAETDRGNSWQSTEPVVKSVPSTATITTYRGNNGALVTIANTETANGKKVLSVSSITGTSYKIENGKIIITTDVRVPVEIIDNQADTNNPTGKTIRVLNGEDIEGDIQDFVNLPNAPQGTKYVWKTKPNTNQPTLTQRKQETGVVEVQYPDGSKEDVTVTADVVPVPPQNTRAYILQHSLESNAKSKIQAVTNRPAAWASGKAAEVVGSIDTSVVGDFNATVSIENRFSVNTGIITGVSSILGTTYSKPTEGITSIVTNVSVPYTIVNKPVIIDNTPLVVEVGSTISNDNLLAKIGNKDGWQVVSITLPDTNSTGNKTATVVLRHPNLPESDNQTFTIPVNVRDTTPPVFRAIIPNFYLFQGQSLDYKVNVEDNVGITGANFVRNGNDNLPLRNFPLTIYGLSVVVENGEVKIKGTNNAFANVDVGNGSTRMRVRTIDRSGNTGDSNGFNLYAVDVQGGSITKDFGQQVTEAEILAQTSLLSRGRLLPNGISAEEEENNFTKTITSVNGQQYNGNNLPTRGNNTVRVRYTNTLTGQNKEVDVAVNFGEPPYCVKPANRTREGLSTKVGITDLGRAGETPDTWPMLRKGGWIALESNNKGFVITRMSTAQIQAIKVPQEGMMVYDREAKCLKIYDGTEWACFSTPACPTE